MYVFGSGGVEGEGAEWMRGLGLGFTNPVGTWRMLDVCLCLGCGGVGGVGGKWVGGVAEGLGGGGVVVCLCELCVRILCVDGRSRYLYMVLGGYLRILGAPSVSTMYLFMADIANPDLFVCSCRTWICLDITHSHEEQRHSTSGSAWPACTKTVNRAPLLGVGGFDTIYTAVCNRRDSSAACRLCHLQPCPLIILSYDQLVITSTCALIILSYDQCCTLRVRMVKGSTLTVGNFLSLENLNVIIRAIN